ncbi:transferase [Lithospermum erythrorhizon]|uniref:glutathione transferase n=1 Tax=Lithospermum erythrorhizon TaxID=34254 RepID=A0AAV3QY98_LITER
MATGDVKLLGYFSSPFVLRVRIALNIKSINYEFIEENMIRKSELLLKSNPIHQKIPVLLHGERPICESLIIVQYIDDIWTTGPSILPSDPHDRAIARFWASYIDDKLFAVLGELKTARGEEAMTSLAKKMSEGLLLLEDAYVKCSKGKTFFGGESIGYLDIALGCILAWLKVIERVANMRVLDETKVPNLVEWADNFRHDPSVKDVIPDAEKLMELYQMFIAKEHAAET